MAVVSGGFWELWVCAVLMRNLHGYEGVQFNFDSERIRKFDHKEKTVLI